MKCEISLLIVRGREMVKIFKALAHEKRVMILGILYDKCRTVKEMCEILNTNRSTVYKHLTKLENAGLVKRIGYRDGDVLYELASAKVYRLLESCAELIEEKSFENVGKRQVLDVRGELCPIPLIKTERAWKKLEPGELLEIWVDYELSKERLLTRYKSFLILYEKYNEFWRIVLKKR